MRCCMFLGIPLMMSMATACQTSWFPVPMAIFTGIRISAKKGDGMKIYHHIGYSEIIPTAGADPNDVRVIEVGKSF